MEVIGLLGSPRRGGNSETLLDVALAGAAAAGAKVEKLVPSEMHVIPCDGCRYCSDTPGQCHFRDDMDYLYRRFREVDRFLIASPLFFLGLPAPIKAVIDRCQALWVIKYEQKGKVGLSGSPRLGFFLAVGNYNRPVYFQPAEATVRAFYISLDVWHAGSSFYGRIDQKGAILGHPTALEEAYALSQRLAAP